MAEKLNIVTGPVAVVIINGAVVNTFKGGALPQNTPKETVEHLIGVGLVRSVELPAAVTETETAGEAPVTIPEGEPSDKWKLPELNAYATRENVELEGATTKAQILEAIAAAAKAKADADQANDDGGL